MKALFISILLIGGQFLFGQIKITYEVTYQPDSTQNRPLKELMSLKYFDHRSYFYSETKIQLDSIYDNLTIDYMKTGNIPEVGIKHNLNFEIYKEFKNKKFYEIQKISSRKFFFENENPQKMNWKINNETKEIKGYLCRNATISFGGREWNAWFTDKIPISDGPYKFYGLPGMILEISDLDNEYQFSTVGIKKYSEKIKLPKGLIRTTEKKFIQLKNKVIKDPALFVRESLMESKNVTMRDTSGNILTPKTLYQKITNESNAFRKTHNNPIEKGNIWLK